MYKFLFTIFIALSFCQFEYTLEDVNPNSNTFGENVWYPDFTDYITIHFFGLQG